MKILQLNNPPRDSFTGGTDVVTQRLHLAFRKAGVDSIILCSFEDFRSSHTAQVSRSKHIKMIGVLIRRVTPRFVQPSVTLSRNELVSSKN